jgi:hypothetical protein
MGLSPVRVKGMIGGEWLIYRKKQPSTLPENHPSRTKIPNHSVRRMIFMK